MEGYHGHMPVLNMMESLTLHGENQLSGLSTLNSMMNASPKLLTLIQKKKNMASIVHEIMRLYAENAQIQSTACQTVCFLSQSEVSRSALLKEDLIGCIIDTMQKQEFLSDVTVQSSACKALRLLLDHDDNLQVEFVESDNHKVIISLLSSDERNPSVLEEALLLLAVLASQEENYDIILQASQHVVPTIMKAYPDNGPLQVASCAFVKNLARTVDSQQLLVMKGVYPLILHVFRKFHSEVDAQLNALMVLDKIARAVLTAPQWLGQRLEDDCWLVETFYAMTYHPGSIECQILACKVLCSLLQHQPEILDGIGEDNSSCLAIDNAVLTGLRLYGDIERDVFVACARAVYHLAVNSRMLQYHLVCKGAHFDIKEGMLSFADDAGAQGAACQAITGLCLSVMENKVKFAQMEIHVQVFTVLKKFSSERPFLDEAIRCITCLADVGVVRNQSMVEGVHEVFMQAMVDNQDDVAFQELCLEAMSVLSSAEGMVDILCEAGLLNNTIHIMEKFSQCENIQQKGSILFQTLVAHQKTNIDTHLSKQVAMAIIQSMNKFQNDETVLAESCVALQLLADKSESISRVLVDNEVHSVLFMVLEKYETNEVLVDLACEVLYILCCRWDFKNEMLLWACKNNLNRGVEVLLQLGADVNSGCGRESPLCFACENDNVKMTMLILQQNVSDMQTALKYCLELEFHHLVGILLKYIGYDQEGGNVIWSSLSLGELHARWFYPTFTKETARISLSQSVTTVDSVHKLASRILSKEAKREKRSKMKHLLSEQQKRRSSLSLLEPPFILSELEAGESGHNGVMEESRFDVSDAGGTLDSSEISPLRDEFPSPDRQVKEESFTEVDSKKRPPALTRDRRSTSVSEEVLSGYKMGRERLSSLDSLSEIRRPSNLLPLRKPSLSSAELPINVEDPRWLSSFQEPLPDKNAKPFHASTPDTTSLSPTRPNSLGMNESLVLPSAQKQRKISDASSIFEENLSPFLRASSQLALSTADVSESSAWEDYLSDAQMPDLVPRDVYSSTPYRSNLRRRSQRSSRMSSVSTISSVDGYPYITYLNLSSNGFSCLGPLIAERSLLLQFQYLTKLDISKNNLTEVPHEFFQALQELESIDISSNHLTILPSEILSFCNKLQLLNVSGNEMYSLPSSLEDSSKSLQEMDLSHNAIGGCPEWLSDYLPNLKNLLLQSCNITVLPDQPLKLSHLTTLNLSYNSISTIPPAFFKECNSLDVLNLSYNKIESLPENAAIHLSKLSVLKLSNNKLGSVIPAFILSLSSLRCVDLSSNGISVCAAPYQWKSQSLKEINLSHNKIKELSLDKKFDLRNWLKMEKLLLSHNKLSKIPKEVGQLTSLCTLDVSHNKDITTIPDQLGTLSKLWEFPLDGLKLDLDPAIRKSRTKDIIGFLNQKLKKAVPYFRMKLMVVGYGGRGKSSLLARLRRDKQGKKRVSTATVGIDVGELKVEVMHNKKSQTFHLTTWDIAGQEDFYSTHPCFLTGRALFLVVYDLHKGLDEVKTIRNWLLTIQALAPFSPVIVVGTHKDKIPKEYQNEKIRAIRDRIKALCLARGFPTVERFAEVSCLHEDIDMEKLRKEIVNAIERATIKGQPIVGQKIPHSYKLLEELFQEEALRLKLAGQNPIMVQSEVLNRVKEKEIPLSEEELVQAARFLHETGVILHYDDPALHLENLFFVQPEWLCKIMAQVITVREINPFINSQGVMRKTDIYQLIKSTVDQSSHFVKTYISLLEKFEVALPISDNELLIPSKVPATRPSVQLPPKEELLHRYYRMPYTPVGLWPRLILRLLHFSTDMLSGEVNENDRDLGWTSKYWKEGIFVSWSKEAFFVVDSGKDEETETISIVVPLTKLGYRVLGQVCDHLDDLIEEWFPGLNELDPMLGTPLLQRCVPCIKCDVANSNQRPYEFSMDELLEQVQHCDTIPCKYHATPVPIKLLAPDVTFADLEDTYHIDLKHLAISFENILGEGSFGSVYEARYRGKTVAVKMFSDRSGIHPHRMMRQEVTVLRHLQHPCLVSMEGVSFSPRILVMELAPLGSLGSLLTSEKGQLNRKLQHKIAMQVAEGLAFLHENRIVYRDLKPDNILIFSLLPGASQNVKISDYGISKFTTPYGLKASEGTPGYRAPEVIKGTSTYNTEVDIFSYGILLFEVVTEGHKPFQDLDFRTEIEEAVVKGRGMPQITECGVPPWPDMQDLINNCTETIPQKRPTAKMALKRLQSADFLCLKQTYALGSINAESMTVRRYRKSKDYVHEVWMTGGDGTSTAVSLINPFTSSSKALVQGAMLGEGRGVCILAAGENLIIVGTQEGKLCVIEPTKDFSGPIKLKHSITVADAVLSLIHQSRADNEGRVLAGLANGTLLVYDVYTLKHVPDGKPLKSLQLNVTSCDPLGCMVLYQAKLYVGCGNHIAVLNGDSLEVESRLIKNRANGESEPGQVRLIAVDKSVWVCRRYGEDSHFIEVWDPGKDKIKTYLDIARLLQEHDPSLTNKQCDIKSMMLQAKTALWVGVASGHLALIDRHTSKLITLVHRYTEALRTIATVKSPDQTKSSSGSIVMTAGKGFLKRPECADLIDEDCVHVLVWDAQLKSQVQYVQSEIDRRNRGGQSNWQKVQLAVRTVAAFHKSH
ncbi:Leucine-rich repeat serine/threonine-protein kinase 2 [Holothuria leucospilota]|uniref:non-specific serine/threonine protein kinase n=1 Tax=Holothuria leucospilota TaxID=206669 RepID=A0A9Q1HI76_HOLLE|nr:Leucine-rich repeat serine/threonine-protein kinase 2 [Holothuria leucospilota]